MNGVRVWPHAGRAPAGHDHSCRQKNGTPIQELTQFLVKSEPIAQVLEVLRLKIGIFIA
jgi:hypothetical protein